MKACARQSPPSRLSRPARPPVSTFDQPSRAVATLKAGHGGPQRPPKRRDFLSAPPLRPPTGRVRPAAGPRIMEPILSPNVTRLRSHTAPEVPRPPVVPVVGVPLALTDYERTMDWMDSAVANGERAIVTAAAVHLVM